MKLRMLPGLLIYAVSPTSNGNITRHSCYWSKQPDSQEARTFPPRTASQVPAPSDRRGAATACQ
jgi:hypothetical protein